MKITSRILILICGLFLASSVFATTSSCYEYYIGSTPYVAHQSTYTSGDAAFGPTFGMKTEVIYPSLPVIDSYWPASSSGGSQTIADTPYYAGYWAWSGAGAIGVYDAPVFEYQTPTFSSCSHNQTYGKPTSVYVDINPNTAEVGETVLFSWGASGVVNQCTLGGSPLSPTQGSNVPVVVGLSDAGTYTVYCSNYWGQSTSPGQDTLTVTCPSQVTSAIAEYSTYGVSLTPSCGDFSQTRSSVYFSFAEINKGDYSWVLVRSPLIAPSSSNYGLDKFRTSFGGSRVINSGYRNPARNSQVGGAQNSRHMYGDAADINNQSGTMNEWLDMVDAMEAANASYIEPSNGPCALDCVHGDWRNYSGTYN